MEREIKMDIELFFCDGLAHIMENIILNLDYESVIACSQVSQKWYKFLSNCPLRIWKYFILKVRFRRYLIHPVIKNLINDIYMTEDKETIFKFALHCMKFANEMKTSKCCPIGKFGFF